MNPGDQLLLGLDMVKDIEVLEKAYNDSNGITAKFNKNIIHVVNGYLGTNLDPNAFEHLSFYNHEEARIEMWLKALTDMEIINPYLTGKIRIEKGETIHTENSHKFTFEHIQAFSNIPGLKIKEVYKDPKHWFSLVQFQSY
jgi:L-histidine N-alpha-methyltransferase